MLFKNRPHAAERGKSARFAARTNIVSLRSFLTTRASDGPGIGEQTSLDLVAQAIDYERDRARNTELLNYLNETCVPTDAKAPGVATAEEVSMFDEKHVIPFPTVERDEQPAISTLIAALEQRTTQAHYEAQNNLAKAHRRVRELEDALRVRAEEKAELTTALNMARESLATAETRLSATEKSREEANAALAALRARVRPGRGWQIAFWFVLVILVSVVVPLLVN